VSDGDWKVVRDTMNAGHEYACTRKTCDGCRTSTDEGFAALERLEAEAAAMREALEDTERRLVVMEFRPDFPALVRIRAALATDAGAAMLAEVKGLREFAASAHGEEAWASLKERAEKAEAERDDARRYEFPFRRALDRWRRVFPRLLRERNALRAEVERRDVALREAWKAKEEHLAQARREERERAVSAVLECLPDADKYACAAAIRALGDVS
jgi:hypothetical protein